MRVISNNFFVTIAPKIIIDNHLTNLQKSI
jgi:hypothetical protein